jgi:RND family efflux transporter MFP subunit
MKKLLIILILSGFLAACHTHEHTDAHSHVHGNEISDHAHSGGNELIPLVYTLYTDSTELFVEFKPLVVGAESRFAAHFTTLGEKFLPIADGSVTLTLSGAGEQSVTADAPEVPGIFRLRIIPEKSGMYHLIFDIKTSQYTDRIVIDSIFVYPDDHAVLHDQHPASGSGDAITYLKEQAWKIDFSTQQIQRKSFYEVVKTSGMISAAPGSEQTLAARTSGVVRFTKEGLMTGLPVSAGQHLFTISSSGLTDNNIRLKIQDAKINLDKAKADYDRQQRLMPDQLTTQREFQQAKTTYESAQAYYNSLTSAYGEGGQVISTTQSGYIKALLISPGQFVEAGQPLAIVSKNNKLVVKAELSQTAFSKISNITSANFKFGDNVFSLDELNGRLIPTGTFADHSLFIPVWFEIENRNDIIPGTYAEVFIHANALAQAITIPLTAVLEEQGNFYAYVQTEGELFEKRQLRLGGNDGKQVQVHSGITEGDRVVTNGAYNIKLSTASGTLPAHGHEH